MWLLNKESTTPFFMQIYEQLKKEILEGTLSSSDRLMGSRSLAKLLGISRNTVDRAYAQLAIEGYIVLKQGQCPAIMELPDNLTSIPKQEELPLKQRKPQAARNNTPVKYDLTNSSHTSNLFPKKIWKKYLQEALDFLEIEERLSTLQNMKGEIELRENLLHYLKKIRGVHCELGQLIITSGLQQSLQYLCGLIDDQNPTVLMENPTYPKAKAVFDSKQYTIDYASIDNQGIIIPENEPNKSLSLIYTTPSHQFPSGITMSIARRRELLDYASKTGAFIVEDDYDSELRYYEQPIPALQSIDPVGKVVYMGTFSKALSPSLRMSYMILPKILTEKFEQEYALFNSTVNLLNQCTVSRIIESGAYERHVRRMNSTFKKRFEAFSHELKVFDGKVSIAKNVSGQYFLLNFTQKIDQDLLIEQALEQGIRVYSTMEFWQERYDCPDNSLFLGFSKIKTEDVKDCVARLYAAWNQHI